MYALCLLKLLAKLAVQWKGVIILLVKHDESAALIELQRIRVIQRNLQIHPL